MENGDVGRKNKQQTIRVYNCHLKQFKRLEYCRTSAPIAGSMKLDDAYVEAELRVIRNHSVRL